MRWVLLAATGVGLLTACEVGSGINAVRQGLPDSNTVKLAVPETPSASLGRSSGLEATPGGTQQGQAFTYVLTRVVTGTVNAEVGAVLAVLASVAASPPASFDGTTAVWGPYSDPLSTNSYRATAKLVGTDQVQYHVDGKPKASDDSAYLTILTGSHSGTAQGQGEGNFEIDFDTFQLLPEHFDQVGKVDVTYSHPSDPARVQIEVDLHNVYASGSHQKRTDGVYHYLSTPGQGGSFDFTTSANIQTDAQHPLDEDLSIRSRWTEAGAGRADAQISGGDLGGQARLNECWDTSFLSRYLNFSLSGDAGGQFAIGYGVEATDCAFPVAEYAP
jgi:hypothetical protein